MGYTAHELAKISGVSVRTLHYYEELGLLQPKRRPNGYRDYGPHEVRALQQILLYRQADMPLADIRTVLNQPAQAQSAALRAQLGRLRKQRQRLDGLIASVERLIQETDAHTNQEGATPMDNHTDTQRFEALKQQAIRENEAAYGTEARERYGDEAVDATNQQVANMSQKDWDEAQAQEKRIGELLAQLAASDNPTASTCSELGRELCTVHRAWLLHYWTPAMYTPEAHRGLARGYTLDPRFVQYYEKYAPNGAALLRDAIEAWADKP